MRLLLPSATIAVVSGTAAVSASETSETFVTSNVVQDVDFAYNASRPRSIKLVSLGEECNNFVSEKNRVPDVGVLGCRGEKQTCVEDYTSSIGGRCAIDRSLLTPKADTVEANPSLPAFSRRRRTQQTAVSDRLLQSSDWICPTNCPKEFCRCAEKYSEVKDCAKEMNDICVDKTVDSCVPDAYLPFYYDTYCPFSECIINNRGYENCSCEYYRNYCTLYYSYEESTSKCEIASCCDLKNSPEDKRECLPAMQPTGSPTMFPTVTSMPSDSPTVSCIDESCTRRRLFLYDNRLLTFIFIVFRSPPSPQLLRSQQSVLLLLQHRPFQVHPPSVQHLQAFLPVSSHRLSLCVSPQTFFSDFHPFNPSA